GLPPGVSATPTVIEKDINAADLVLMADVSAPPFSPPTWRLVARSVGSSPGQEVRRTLDPGGPKAGWITVTGEPNLKIGFRPDRVRARRGGRDALDRRAPPGLQGSSPDRRAEPAVRRPGVEHRPQRRARHREAGRAEYLPLRRALGEADRAALLRRRPLRSR